MSTRRSYPCTYVDTLADGTKVTRTRQKTYIVKTNRPVITDEMRQKIIEMRGMSIPKTVIARNLGITTGRVTTVLKNAQKS